MHFIPIPLQPSREAVASLAMPEYDPDERFSLYPLEGEDVLRRLLGAEDDIPEDPEGGSLTEDATEP